MNSCEWSWTQWPWDGTSAISNMSLETPGWRWFKSTLSKLRAECLRRLPGEVQSATRAVSRPLQSCCVIITLRNRKTDRNEKDNTGPDNRNATPGDRHAPHAGSEHAFASPLQLITRSYTQVSGRGGLPGAEPRYRGSKHPTPFHSLLFLIYSIKLAFSHGMGSPANNEIW